MLVYFLKVLAAAWPLALSLTLTFSVLSSVRQFDRGQKGRRVVFGGFVLGTLAALTLAALKFRTGFPAGHPLYFLSRIVVNREYWNLALLWPLIPVSVAFIVKCKAPRSRIAVSAPGVLWLGAALVAFWLAYGSPDLFIFPFDFGVGLDSVFNLDYLARASGYFFGITLLAVLSLGLYGQLLKAPQSLSKGFLKASLIVLLGLVLLKTAQIMVVRGLVPRSRTLTRAVIFALDRENFFLYAQMAIWGGLALIQAARAKLTSPTGANPALVRKARADLRAQFFLGLLVLGSFAVFFFSITALKAYAERGPLIAEPLTVTANKEGLIELDLAVVGDGRLHRRQFQASDGTYVRFIVIRKSERAYGVGLDACDICGATGYYQRGDQVICKLCDVVMNKVTIGFPGGCNPVPLAFKIESGKLIVEASSLEKEKRRFR
jgi:uncharacterized membrane protein